MVEHHDAAAHAAAARIVVRRYQRTHAGVGAQDARMFQRRGQFHSLAQQQVDLVGRHVHVVHLVEGHLARRGADQRDRIARHQDVGVGRLAAAVEHDVVHPVAEDQQRALGRQHVDRHPRLAGDVVPQMPPALTTTCARYSAVWPVLRSSTLTPVMRFCSRRKSSTSW